MVRSERLANLCVMGANSVSAVFPCSLENVNVRATPGSYSRLLESWHSNFRHSGNLNNKWVGGSFYSKLQANNWSGNSTINSFLQYLMCRAFLKDLVALVRYSTAHCTFMRMGVRVRTNRRGNLGVIGEILFPLCNLEISFFVFFFFLLFCHYFFSSGILFYALWLAKKIRYKID